MFEAHLHPILSSLPFALVSIAFIAEIVAAMRPEKNLDSVVSWNLLGAVLTIIAAFLSGYLAADYGHLQLKIAEEQISAHHLWGKGGLVVAILTLILHFVARYAKFYRKQFIFSFRCLLVLFWALTIITGFLGGEMLLIPR